MTIMSYHRDKIDDSKPADTGHPDPTNDTVDEDEEVNMERGED